MRQCVRQVGNKYCNLFLGRGFISTSELIFPLCVFFWYIAEKIL